MQATSVEPDEAATLDGFAPTAGCELGPTELDAANVRCRHDLRRPQCKVECHAIAIRILTESQITRRGGIDEFASLVTRLGVDLEEPTGLHEKALDERLKIVRCCKELQPGHRCVEAA